MSEAQEEGRTVQHGGGLRGWEWAGVAYAGVCRRMQAYAGVSVMCGFACAPRCVSAAGEVLLAWRGGGTEEG